VVTVQTPGQVLTMRLEKVAHNVPVDETLFRKPAAKSARRPATPGSRLR
jgi:hypothetical protein